MPASASNQTISYLGRRFSEAGVRLNARYGQHFLIDGNLLRLIVDRAEVDQRDVVLEVGTGTGALTALIAPLAAAVVTVEIDEQLHQLAREELIAHKNNVVMLLTDALAGKNSLKGAVVAAIEKELAAAGGRRFKLVANLPYNLATPLIANLLCGPLVPHSMTVTVQKEVAQRIVARSGSKDFGALSVWVQSQCQAQIVRTLAPSVFWPRPQVHSAIVHIDLDQPRRAQIADLSFFHDFVRALFSHRRKFLRSVLAAAFDGALDKAAIERILTQQEISQQARGEQLDLPAILRLAEAVRRALAGRRGD